MATIYHDDDAPLDALEGARVAVLGYGNQGSAWAQNLRDSGLDVIVGTISDASQERAVADGFPARDIPAAVADAAVVCLLIPDEVMAEVFARDVAPNLHPGDAVCFASGYALAYDEVSIPGGADVFLVAPRMLGVGVRESFVDGSGFIAFVGVEQDPSGSAMQRCLAIARGIGATHRGALELDARAEAALDLFVEQAIAPALGQVWRDAALVLLEHGIPLEAVLVEFYVSGEVERTYKALREIGYVAQSKLHSQTSHYGTLSRAERFADLDTKQRMSAVLEEITSGAFAKEWAEERAAGYPRLRALEAEDPRALLTEFEDQVRAAFTPR